MKSDAQTQKDVIDQLKWEPFLNATEIGVAVKDGIVTLSGQVDAYSKKVAAEKAVKKVAGVRGIAEDIQIGISPSYRLTDSEIASAVFNALKSHIGIQEEKITIKVEDGIVKLEGELDWDYQRKNAISVVENLPGVRLALNYIKVKPRLTSNDIQYKISAAFHRSATIDADKITAEVLGNTVILKGKVRSYSEKEDAENAAWKAPGIIAVKNKLEIEVPEYAFD